jgi:hypothetical protein
MYQVVPPLTGIGPSIGIVCIIVPWGCIGKLRIIADVASAASTVYVCLNVALTSSDASRSCVSEVFLLYQYHQQY